jgi:hypothetical protein
MGDTYIVHQQNERRVKNVKMFPLDFDMDHAENHDAFRKAELIVQRKHCELARSGHPRLAAARAHWDHPALRYRLID